MFTSNTTLEIVDSSFGEPVQPSTSYGSLQLNIPITECEIIQKRQLSGIEMNEDPNRAPQNKRMRMGDTRIPETLQSSTFHLPQNPHCSTLHPPQTPHCSTLHPPKTPVYYFAMGGIDESGDRSDLDDDGVDMDDDVDDKTLAFLKLFAPQQYEKLIMRRTIRRDIVETKPNIRWNDIANQIKAKLLLQEAIILPLEKPSYFTGLRKPWKGVLLVGPPGTGKTMLAKAVATEKGLTFFNINISTLTSKYYGESEKLIKILFEEARARAPSVVFIDEIDSICSARGETSEHEATRRMKSEFLCHMDGILSSSINETDPKKSVVILGATNFPWGIDKAFLRRMEKRIYVPLPDEKSRHELLNITLQDIPMRADVDLELISDKLNGYSSADIVHVCRDAAMMSMRKVIKGKTINQIKKIPMSELKKPISKDDFNNAIKKCQKTVTASEIKRYEEWNAVFGSSV